MNLPHKDVDAFLRKHGWDMCSHNVWYRGADVLHLTPAVLELIDALYLAGCQFGVGRGAYEQMVQEDVEAGDIVQDTTQTGEKCPKCLQYYTAGLLTC